MHSGKNFAILLFVVLAQCLVGQRSPVFVTVLGAKGEPLVGAEVVCSFASDMLTPFPSDVVTAVTDGRGRARCNLQVGRVYCAWAVGPKQGDGGYYVSRVMRLISSGRLIELDAAYWRAAMRVKLEGLAAWRRLGAVGVRWFPVVTEDYSFDLPLPADDVVELPAACWNDGCLALTTKAGTVLTATKVQAEGGADVWFDAPVECKAHVTGPDDQPLAGVKIEVLIPRLDDQRAIFDIGQPWLGHRAPAGSTKADGNVQFHALEYVYRELGGADHARSVYFVASKPGYTTSVRAVKKDGTFRIQLRESENVQLTFVGDFVDKLTLAASSVEDVSLGRGRRAWIPKPVPLTKLGDGRWNIPETGDYFRWRIAVAAKLPCAVVVNQTLPVDKAWALRLRDQAKVRVQVTDSLGQPAPCALGVALVEDNRVDWHALVATSIGGMAEVVVPRGKPYFVYASTGSSHAMEFLDLKKSGPLDMQLERIPTMRVHAVNNVGQSMVMVGIAYRHSSYPEARRGGGFVTRKDVLKRLARGLRGAYTGRVSSDRNGILHVPVLWQTSKHRVQAKRGDEISKGFRLVPDGEQRVVLKRR